LLAVVGRAFPQVLACESDLAGPEPDAAVTELQQPPSTQPLFDEGPNGPGCSVIADGCGATERNGNGPNDAGPTGADASTADTDAVTEGKGKGPFGWGGYPGGPKSAAGDASTADTDAVAEGEGRGPIRARHGTEPTSDTDAVTESEGTPTKKKVQARVGRY